MISSVGWCALVHIRFFGHAFFKLSFRGKNVLIDPFVGKTNGTIDFSCLETPKVKDSDLKDIDLVLITHEHFDHFDPELIKRIVLENNACLVCHESLVQQLELPKRFVHAISTGEHVSLRGVDIVATDAHHPKAFYPMGYLVSGNGHTVFHAGDTDLLDDFSKIKADVALLPIGGYETMDVVDAIRATKAMKPEIAIPMHYNTFKMIKADPLEFKYKIEKSILKTQPVILKAGQCFKM
ncbi:MAG: metal-dependent hydrolase [Candidatus Diapherotrites archaeon]|uniref:Metal-dependent hydrolase n=1 Tax=Candidatus Iainarchaeum sp. TaxID=3101447 RepID=A0A8T4L8P6_9ARCH|nr:metal-dependent hydrolase [Candidatus Diapherotrites archaeon]